MSMVKVLVVSQEMGQQNNMEVLLRVAHGLLCEKKAVCLELLNTEVSILWDSFVRRCGSGENDVKTAYMKLGQWFVVSNRDNSDKRGMVFIRDDLLVIAKLS